MLRVGQIGLGAWGARVLPHLAAIADLRAVVTSSADKVPEALRESVRVDATPEALFEDPTVDAVVLTTPVSTHRTLTESALRHGKHVLVEKPLGMDEEAALECARLAGEFRRTLAVGYIYLHSPCLAFLQGLPGAVESVATAWTKTGSFSGPIEESLFCHEVALLTWLLGAPSGVRAYGLGLLTAEDVIVAEFEYAEAKATAYVSRVSENRRKAMVLRRNGETYEWSGDEVRRLDEAQEKWHTVFSHGEDLIRLEIQDFVDACQMGRPPRVDGMFAASVHATLRQAVRA